MNATAEQVQSEIANELRFISDMEGRLATAPNQLLKDRFQAAIENAQKSIINLKAYGYKIGI